MPSEQKSKAAQASQDADLVTDPLEVQARLLQLMKIADEDIVEFDDPVPVPTAADEFTDKQ